MSRASEFNVGVGARIKEMRIKRNMTQDVFAEKTGICSGQQVSNIERGVRGISLAKLKEICEVLEVESDYIIFGVNSNNAETQISKYLKEMGEEQIGFVMEFVKLYAKSCGIE